MHFKAVYFDDQWDDMPGSAAAQLAQEEESAFAEAIEEIEEESAQIEFEVPSPALRTPAVAATSFTFDSLAADLEQRVHVTPQNVPTPGWPATPEAQQQPTPPRTQIQSPLAKKQRLQQTEPQPSTSAQRQVLPTIAEQPLGEVERIVRPFESFQLESVPPDGDCFYW